VLLAALSLGGCAADTATQVLVVLRAETGFEAARALTVRVERADGTVAFESTEPLTDPLPEPLARVPLVPLDGDATRTFRVRAALLDGSGQRLAELEASGGYTADTLRELSLWFEAACAGVLDCGPGRTCSGGTCLGACFVPTEVGAEPRAAPTCGECQECSDRVCTARAEESPCGCAGDRCRGGACAVARPTTSVVGGQLHTCAGSGGTLYCWGGNRVGQLGTGAGSTTTPTRVDLDGWAETTAAQDHTCAVLIGGARTCWGWNGNAQLGNGAVERRAIGRPTLAPAGDLSWSTLASGWFHTCGLTRDRRLACWGSNSRSASAEPAATEAVVLPTPVDDSVTWSGVTAGGFHSCGVKSDGSLWCWGMNESGELGLGDAADREAPTQVGCTDGRCTTGWTTVGAGSFHTCAIRGAGELWCWGGGQNGQLGVGTNATEDSATLPRACRARRVAQRRRRHLAQLRPPERRQPVVLGPQRPRPARPGRHADAPRTRDRPRPRTHRLAARGRRTRAHLRHRQRSLVVVLGRERRRPAGPRPRRRARDAPRARVHTGALRCAARVRDSEPVNESPATPAWRGTRPGPTQTSSHVRVARMDGCGPAPPAAGPFLAPLRPRATSRVARMDGCGPAPPAAGPILAPLRPRATSAWRGWMGAVRLRRPRDPSWLRSDLEPRPRGADGWVRSGSAGRGTHPGSAQTGSSA
jgi:hypothetical protein